MTSYSPLMLAIAKGEDALESIKRLLSANANFKAVDAFGNNVLHIASIYSNNLILNYLCNNLKIDA